MSPSFAELGVPTDIVAALSRRSIEQPFPIQVMTLPDALAGRDICGRAPTGSGKTLAFGIATLGRLKPSKARSRRPRSLILTPTRELCAQVADALTPLAAAKGWRVSAFYGGVGYQRQITNLAKGVDVAVACPGRLMDLIERGDVKLDSIEVVVVDEADRMADMGFLPEVRRLLDQTPPERQTLLFSATLDGEVDVLVRKYQKSPARHELESEPEDKLRAEHLFWKVASADRVAMAAAVVDASGPTILFSRTKHGADRMTKQLAQHGVRATAIHGDRSQGQRERALASFMAGHFDALVATDVAARGIHVDGVAAVVHLDPPADAKDYVHRSGRTARAGATGVVVSFVSPDKMGAVKRLQRDLCMPAGTVVPNVEALSLLVPERAPKKEGEPSSFQPESEGRSQRRSGGFEGGSHRRRTSTKSGSGRKPFSHRSSSDSRTRNSEAPASVGNGPQRSTRQDGSGNASRSPSAPSRRGSGFNRDTSSGSGRPARHRGRA